MLTKINAFFGDPLVVSPASYHCDVRGRRVLFRVSLFAMCSRGMAAFFTEPIRLSVPNPAFKMVLVFHLYDVVSG